MQVCHRIVLYLKFSSYFHPKSIAGAATGWYRALWPPRGAGTRSVKSRHCVDSPHLRCTHLTPLFLWFPGTQSAAHRSATVPKGRSKTNPVFTEHPTVSVPKGLCPSCKKEHVYKMLPLVTSFSVKKQKYSLNTYKIT